MEIFILLAEIWSW